jgi:hypothetical protein
MQHNPEQATVMCDCAMSLLQLSGLQQYWKAAALLPAEAPYLLRVKTLVLAQPNFEANKSS